MQLEGGTALPWLSRSCARISGCFSSYKIPLYSTLTLEETMADIHIKRTHKLTLEEARTRVQKAADEIKAKYGAKSEWKGQNLLAFSATGVKGGIEVKEGELEVKVELGFLA